MPRRVHQRLLLQLSQQQFERKRHAGGLRYRYALAAADRGTTVKSALPLVQAGTMKPCCLLVPPCLSHRLCSPIVPHRLPCVAVALPALHSAVQHKDDSAFTYNGRNYCSGSRTQFSGSFTLQQCKVQCYQFGTRCAALNWYPANSACYWCPASGWSTSSSSTGYLYKEKGLCPSQTQE